jgi:hypothetical protein
MKWYFYPLYLFLILFASCGEDENLKLEVYNTEAFVFDTGDEYEVNALVRLKGFKLQEEGEEFTSSVSYDIDLLKPDGSREEAFISKVKDFEFSEEVKDAGLDIQFNLDKSYIPGKYTMVINLTDNNTDNTTQTSAGFELTE